MNTCLLTPQFEDVIEAMEVVKDLNFNTQVEIAALLELLGKVKLKLTLWNMWYKVVLPH